MPTIQIIPEADFDRDGTYETDLSTYFNERAGGMEIARGASNQGELSPGTLSLDLDNFDGTFTLEYSGSALYGQMEPHVPIRVRAVVNGTEGVLFTGYISRYRPEFGAIGENRCSIEAKDLAAHLAGFPLVNLTVDERTTGQAIEAIADALGILPITLADPGVETLPIHWCRNANALNALLDVVKSEMGGDLFVDADGNLNFIDRSRRLGTADLADSWGTGSLVDCELVQPDLTDDDLITSCAVQCSMFLLSDQEVQVFQFSRGSANAIPDSLYLPANVPYEAELDFGSPVTGLVTPVAYTDYSANSAIDGSGTDQTSSLTVTVTDHGAGFGLRLVSTVNTYVTFLQVRGLPNDFVVDRPVFVHKLSIPRLVMDQGVTLQVPFAQDEQASRDYPVGVCRTYRYAYPFVRLSFAWDTDEVAASMLAVELWDLIYFADTGPGGSEFLTNIRDYFYVTGIQHRFTPGAEFRTDVTLIPAYLYFDLDSIVVDDFNRANASGDLGTALSADVWANDSGFDIASGAARANTDSASTPYLALGDSTDQVVEVQLSSIGAGDEVGVTFRYEDANNHYRAYVDKGSNEVIVERVVGGVVTEVSSPAYTVGTSAEIRAIIQDTRIRVWVDRRLYVDATDTGWAPGYRCGLFARNASGTTKFSNFHGRGI